MSAVEYDVVYPIERNGVIHVPAEFLHRPDWRRIAGPDAPTRITLDESDPRTQELLTTGLIAAVPS